MDLGQILQATGLNEKQAKVYLACLKLGSDTAYNIAKQSELKRTTVYFVLEQLKEKGMVSIRQTKKAVYYKAVNPGTILNKIKRQEENLVSILPDLEKLYEAQPTKPQIEVFEGKEGVRQIYQQMEKYLNKGEEVIYWGSFAHFFQPDYKDLLDWWIKIMKNKKYKARELLMASEAKETNYLESIAQNQNPYHLLRIAPRGTRFDFNDNGIFGNKVAIFSLRKEVFVVVIESEDIANSYRNFFELAWKSAKK